MKSFSNKRLPSIRTRLILSVNGVLLLFVIVFLAFDYIREIDHQLAQKQIALTDEASTLLPGILSLKNADRHEVQAYINDVCGRMNDVESPLHHIAVELDGNVIQAHAHHRQSRSLFSAMKQAAQANDGRVRRADYDLVVGTQQQGPVAVFVSEDVSNLRNQVVSDVGFRMLGLLTMALIAIAIVNIVLVHMVSRPLDKLVDKVREVGQGEFNSAVDSFGTAELNFLSCEMNAMSAALEAADKERKSRLKKAHEIQQKLLPPNHREIPGMDVHCLYEPAEEVGGDYYDILSLGHNQWLICLADATDHGVPAAMSAAMLKMLLLQAIESKDQPDKMLEEMNERFMQVHPYGNFASIILVKIDMKDDQLVYANAGHDPAWLIYPDGNKFGLKATGTLLGILEDADFPARHLPLSPGCRLVISTDGITEASDGHGEMYGRDRLLKLLLTMINSDAQSVLDSIQQDVADVRGSGKQADDVTLLIMDYKANGQTNKEQE